MNDRNQVKLGECRPKSWNVAPDHLNQLGPLSADRIDDTAANALRQGYGCAKFRQPIRFVQSAHQRVQLAQNPLGGRRQGRSPSAQPAPRHEYQLLDTVVVHWPSSRGHADRPA
ncbi:MAG: hypothetical protein K0R61_5145 [Microvirga sp.]|nr:hypothetical protein [Microvirga sp.]